VLDAWSIDGETQPGRSDQLSLLVDDNHVVAARFVKSDATFAYTAPIKQADASRAVLSDEAR
jgi:hypothetical protein